MDSTDDVSHKRAQLKCCPPGHRGRDDALFDLAWVLHERFKKKRRINDLNEAITLHGDALELRQLKNDSRARSLHELALCLSYRYCEKGAVDDLKEAIRLGREALQLHRPGHPSRDVVLYNLARDLRRKFEKQADMLDLNEAIELLRDTLKLRPPGQLHRSLLLHSLARCLSDRYRVVANYGGAILLGTVLTPRQPGHPDGGTADIDEAIALEKEAMQLLRPGDFRYTICRSSLILCVRLKTKSQANMPFSDTSPVPPFDLKQAIRNVAFETLKTMPPRLLHTGTGTLCNRNVQISRFMGSQQCNQLLSSCAKCDPDQRMRLIRTEVSRYFQFVMFSHRWGKREPLLRDIEDRAIYNMRAKGGLRKLQVFCTVASECEYLWAWSDTCCIDKDSSAELQEAIGSMFTWYRRSALTIVYLPDVSGTGSLGISEWFERGWTLQELLAPSRILFYTQTWSLYKNLTSLNHKADVSVLGELERATGIKSRFLTNFFPGVDDARLRLQWASSRRTTRPEDIAYSLFGIFNIRLPVLYGESAKNALARLLAEIISHYGDISVLDWTGEASPFHSCFPFNITSYQKPPFFPPQASTVEHVTTRVAWRMAEQPSSSTALQTLYRSLTKLPLPRFVNHRLILSCIVYAVTGVQRRRAEPFARGYKYKIQASGLKTLEITLPSELESGTLQLVRPWCSKLLGPTTESYATTQEQLLFTLERPFNALLLIQLRHNEYKRIACSTSIIAQPINLASILQSHVRTLKIV
ncbi:hypothetical protein F5J12DRAFT_65921 [Pisolithus orientalis]|uniref:uncharacterized protein n=1 Tax=Pisolithus orientalis TaxID=936130 RepID=UPI002224B144|nr:uncharacterized protein F5J12DRAFT_65921 [Pisolithus orientalis]KAI6008164.1 hypothetical protein F5J12DRAFT_65921 [Pisolithus orientalis]